MVKDRDKQNLLALFISVLFFSGHASSSNITPGQLALSGELVAAACDIDPASRELWIEFGQVSARDINMVQEDKLIRPFVVNLIGCQSFGSQNQSTAVAYATITFNGNVYAEDPTVLMPSGEGKGFGVRISDHNGEALTFGKPSSGYLFSDENNALKFTAMLVPVQKYIQAGDFYAVTSFFMDYN
ncbi:fimbrial protein [uncultured Cedecea sp.]|uniref:fimbrial protein n=1 Tax=uncultured Cedecea sp. TaxID=988762 RepID=UPI00263452BA|nr:fimbrial protein [uncultured Cedecea sp.]